MIAAVACTGSVSATHLVGGDLGYEFMGETAPGTNIYRYKLKMRVYLNCGPSSSFPSIVNWLISPSTPLPVGVYAEDPANPDADKLLFTSGDLFLVTYNVITPDLPDSCQLGEGQCVEESIFEGEVELPANTGGYHLYFQGYARNEAIMNLISPGETGFGLYAYIPPASIPNSSPEFLGIPVPFVCIGDTTFFSNAAEDADGDSLVFSFEVPYDSQTAVGGISAAPATLFWPVVEVVYQGGFNALQPFGTSGYAMIDPQTGATAYGAPVIGNWAVAVVVKEYRNGQLIGRIRSDMQLLSVPCTDNLPPVPQNGELVTAYSVNAGDTLCFPFTFIDPDGDLVNFSVNGPIFDGGVFDPPAQITGPASGDSIITTTFCWATVCDQGSADPYNFSVIAYDDACPPGIYSAVISVHVVPGEDWLAIDGPVTACAGQTTGTYCAPVGNTFAWSVTGGTVTGPADDPCVDVDWGPAGVGSVFLTSSYDDCELNMELPVNIHESPPADFLVELDTTCLGLSATATYTGPAINLLRWALDGHPLASSAGTPIFPFGASGALQLTVTNEFGCVDSSMHPYVVAGYHDLITFKIPNVFTPNGDSFNERFQLITTQQLDECLTVTIYDRWGNLVYRSTGGGITGLERIPGQWRQG